MMEQTNKNHLDLLEPYWRRKWLIIILAIAGTCISIAIALSLTKVYRSSTMILVEKQQVSERYVTSTERTPFQERLNTIKQQIMSRTNLEKIIDDFNLYADAKNTPRDEIIEEMREKIEVQIIGSRNRGGDAFNISYINKDPKVTMDVTNTLASMFINENLKRREQSVEGTSDFISKELEKSRLALEKQEAELKAFKDRHMGALPNQLNSNLRTLDRLQLEMQSVDDNLKNATDRKILLDRSLGSSTSTSGSGEVAGSSSPQASQLMDELDNLKMELSQMLTKYKERYPDVIIAKNRIAEIEEKLELMEEEADSLETVEKKKSPVRIASQADRDAMEELFLVKSEIGKLKRRERAIRSEIKMYEKRVEETSANEQKLADIQRDYDISNRNYESLLEKKISAELAENLEKRQKGERFRIIDPAYLPEKPFKPNRKMIVLMGFLISAGIGIGLIYLLEFFNPVIRKPEDLEGVIAYPVLAVIPEFSVSHAKKKIKAEKELRLIKGGKQ